MNLLPKPARQQRTLFFEPLEGRRLLAGLAFTGISQSLPPVAHAPIAQLSYLASTYQVSSRDAVAAELSPALPPNAYQASPSPDAEGEAATQRPTLIAPLNGSILETTSVTLKFTPVAGYTGKYYVRLHDLNWDGKQAAGFRHDSTLHYLSIATYDTSITLPVKPGASYRWWVHQPNGEAADASFTVLAGATPPPPVVSQNVPQLLAPLNGTVVDTASVTLKFVPIQGYTGKYYVRLHDLNWDGKQAAGFQHDSTLHYLSIATYDTSITLPVKPGASYRWWVHRPNGEAAGASFTVQGSVTPPAPVVSQNVPQLLAPLNGTVVDTASVTLKFAPIQGYTGKYYVRLHDLNWDGKQASGFQHDSTLHYLSIATYDTSVTLPVKPGASYRWWVHKPNGEAAEASFTVQGSVTPPPPVVSQNVPQLLAPLNGTVVDTASVTLKFAPIQGYTGKYYVRLHDLNWDGKQASGFQHDSTLHYLSIATYDTSITLPVKPGASYRWWVHKPNDEAAVASFTVSSNVPAPPSPVTDPKILAPLPGDVVASNTVTLRFQPVAGYSGVYYVRLHDQNWDGKQAPGFNHDSKVHYLSVATKQTSITVPVKPGAHYRWWVHTPNSQVDSASFTTAGNSTLPVPPSEEEILPPELIEGRYVATSFTAWSGKNIDVSGALQRYIDMTPIGATLEIPAGKYFVNHQILVNRRITISSAGKSITDPAASASSDDCAELIASPALNEPGGIFYITDMEALHHIIINGNKSGRRDTPAYDYCATSTNNRYGFNATLLADNVQIVGNTFKNALGGTGLEVRGVRHNILISNNEFSSNGVHNQSGLWADGLTIHDMVDSRIEGNRFFDNTDIDLILGGGVDSVITGNEISHSSSVSAGAFAGLMIHKWGSSSGNYSGTVISHNIIDGGPQRTIGSGIYLASEGWYDQTPYGSTVANTTGASIHDNTIRNVQNGLYIAAQGFAVHDNTYANAHGGTIRTNIGHVNSVAPIIVSPTSRWIDFRGENVNPLTSGLFASASWRGHIPNWPF